MQRGDAVSEAERDNKDENVTGLWVDKSVD